MPKQSMAANRSPANWAVFLAFTDYQWLFLHLLVVAIDAFFAKLV